MATVRPIRCSWLREDLPIAACHPQGTVARGATCLENAQCTTGLCLRDPTRHDSACGTCEPRAQPGEQCFMGFAGPRLGCPIGYACSRGYCIGPLKDDGETCGAGSAWSSDCYNDSMFGRGGAECEGPAPTEESRGVCRRDAEFSPCVPDQTCLFVAGEGEACGDVAGRDGTVECAFPLLCTGGMCAWGDSACR